MNIDAQGLKFTLHCFEDRNRKGDNWVITETQRPNIPNDEIASFTLEGDIGVYVEFFNTKNFSKKGKTWAEATIRRAGQKILVDNMRTSVGDYLHHKHKKDDNIDGKVSSIMVMKKSGLLAVRRRSKSKK